MWWKRIIILLILFLFPFLIYISTLAPTVTLIDAGEFITAAQYFNILHPTGYPLYTILIRLASFVPGKELALKINLLSALFSSLSAVFLFLFFFRLHQEISLTLFLTSLYSFSLIVWSISNEAEVYSLTALFSTLIIYLLFRQEERNFFPLIAFLLGLSLTNHMMIISILFSSLLFSFLSYKRDLFKLLPIALFFLFGLSLYLFLPIRASSNPLFSWGNPRDFTRFLWHITGKQYRVWMFSSSFSEIKRNFLQGVSLLTKNTLFLSPLSLLGIFLAWRKDKRVAAFFIFVLLFSLFYAINYTIPDIQPYYHPPFLALLFFLSFPLKALLTKWRKLSLLYLFFIPLPISLQFQFANRRDYYLAEDFARNGLTIAPDSAIILTNWWDFYAPTLYLQHIKNFRRDICLIDKELLRRSWYFLYLERVYPWLLENSKGELVDFLSYLHQFEYGGLKDPSAIQNSFIRLIRSFSEKNPNRRSFFLFLPSLDYDLLGIIEGKRVIPYGILWEMRNDSTDHPIDYNRLQLRLPKKRLEEREERIIRYYYLVAQERTRYHSSLQKGDMGLKIWLEKIEKVLKRIPP